MKIWKLCFIIMFPLRTATLGGEDTVDEDIGSQQLERLVEMLTNEECKDLLKSLSNPEKDIVEQAERLSEEKNDLELRRQTRDTSSAVDNEAVCQKDLTDLLLRFGKQIYYDRLIRALQNIDRFDIALEVGKNINQDKILNLKRYVAGYHKYVSKSFKSDAQQQGRKKKRQVKDLTWSDLNLIVVRAAVPPYQKGPLLVVIPILYGLLLGFAGTFLAGALILLVIIHLANRK